MRSTTAATIAVAATFILYLPTARAEVVDGGFEQGPRGWKTVLTVPSTGEVPFCAVGLNLPAPPGASEGRRHLAVLGDVSIRPTPGCNPAFIYQEFECDSDPSTAAYCTVNFDASLWLAPGEKAAVLLQTGDFTAAREIPSAAGGLSARYSISVEGCGYDGPKNRLVFVLWVADNKWDGTRSVLWIDNVDSYCTADDKSSAGLKPISLDEVPVDPVTLAGHLLRSDISSADCNNNGIPDTFELTQNPTADQDGDKILDACAGEETGINWILLCMGVLILGVTLLRVVRKNRARPG